MNRTLPATLWILGAAAGALSTVLPGSVPPAGNVAPMALATGALVALAVHLFLPRPGILEVGLAASLALAWAAGPGAGAGAAAIVAGLVATSAAYFILRLDARARHGADATQETRERARAAMAFGSRRILLIAATAGLVALGLFYLPRVTASWLGPRWGASLDAASVPLLGAIALAFLALATGWTILRLAHAEPSRALPDAAAGEGEAAAGTAEVGAA